MLQLKILRATVQAPLEAFTIFFGMEAVCIDSNVRKYNFWVKNHCHPAQIQFHSRPERQPFVTAAKRFPHMKGQESGEATHAWPRKTF